MCTASCVQLSCRGPYQARYPLSHAWARTQGTTSSSLYISLYIYHYVHHYIYITIYYTTTLDYVRNSTCSSHCSSIHLLRIILYLQKSTDSFSHSFNLDRNNLSGQIPPGLNSLTALRELKFAVAEKISGTLPEISALTMVQGV